jgi:hypothetical protein
MSSRLVEDSEVFRQKNIRILDPKLPEQAVRDRGRMMIRSLMRRAREW